MSKEFINPPDLPNWEQAFSQIVVVSDGVAKTVYISGQVSVDKDKNLIGAGDLSAQAMQAFQNLEIALRAVNATASDVVKLNIYVKDYKPADAALINAALTRYFTQARLPTSTWLGVQSLAEEGFLIEVDAIAVVEQ
ncbi:MAG: RidA family protein [Acidobacteria bacterium]|nr:MAG: RidA family protein [Acidobacteriota bacterium]